MRKRVEVLVIGGGIAGISAAARIAQHAETIVLERESALGYHSSGRSATFYHFGIGNDAVRGMTAASSEFFAAPPADYHDGPLWTAKPALFIADRNSMGRKASSPACSIPAGASSTPMRCFRPMPARSAAPAVKWSSTRR